MEYIVPYASIMARLAKTGEGESLRLVMTTREFADVLRLILRAVAVDEKWYLETYPDVAEAIASGSVKSAKQHFIDDGYFEGRVAAPLVVDQDWYLSTYEDVAQSIECGEIESAQAHFVQHGYEEGRLPAAY